MGVEGTSVHNVQAKGKNCAVSSVRKDRRIMFLKPFPLSRAPEKAPHLGVSLQDIPDPGPRGVLRQSAFLQL